MTKYNLEDFTFGYELELGDVYRHRVLPEHFGSWEYAECDIVNIHGKYAGIACDPLGRAPPVGGEINVYPTRTVEELRNTIMQCITWFRQHDDEPSASCVNHGHVHVRAPGLRDDVGALKRLTECIYQHQHYLIEHCYGYQERLLMAKTRTARTYLKWDGGRPMPDWMALNIVDKAENFDDFIRIQCCGKDGVSRGRPFRYAINTYCLKHTDTIEFRLFRASLNEDEIAGSIKFARDFLDYALNETYALHKDWAASYDFPKFTYNHEHYLGWERTKWGKERGKKVRHLIEI